jgi:phage replication-related protein YjqB (UPF0714/DUF867 family)
VDRYANFAELKRHAVQGRDFLIEVRHTASGVAVMAPHGGGIEPGTAVIAAAIAGRNHSYYAFKGIRSRYNGLLHIASERFDEPTAAAIVQSVHTVITIHGCRGIRSRVWVGGLDLSLKGKIIDRLNEIGFRADNSSNPALRGVHRKNLCNRGRRAKGVQLEISSGLRRELAGSNHWRAVRRTEELKRFARAVRSAL